MQNVKTPRTYNEFFVSTIPEKKFQMEKLEKYEFTFSQNCKKCKFAFPARLKRHVGSIRSAFISR